MFVCLPEHTDLSSPLFTKPELFDMETIEQITPAGAVCHLPLAPGPAPPRSAPLAPEHTALASSAPGAWEALKALQDRGEAAAASPERVVAALAPGARESGWELLGSLTFHFLCGFTSGLGCVIGFN